MSLCIDCHIFVQSSRELSASGFAGGGGGGIGSKLKAAAEG